MVYSIVWVSKCVARVRLSEASVGWFPGAYSVSVCLAGLQHHGGWADAAKPLHISLSYFDRHFCVV